MDLPANLCLLETQVAGHTIDGQFSKFGMLRDKSSNSVFKPLGKPVCAEREIAFYKQLNETRNDVNEELKQFVPRYDGHMEMDIYGKKHLFIKLENLTHLMSMPCVMDIKIGKRTWDPLASVDKMLVEKQKYAACKNTIGLCVPGFQIYNINGETLKFGKEYGKGLDQKTFCDTLVMFLSAQSTCYKPLLKSILNQLYHLQKWFTTQTSRNFFSSSILIAYDYKELLSNVKRNTKDCWDERKDNNFGGVSIPWVKVNMIDFAHVFETETKTYDTNYLFGLQNLIYILQNILIENW